MPDLARLFALYNSLYQVCPQATECSVIICGKALACMLKESQALCRVIDYLSMQFLNSRSADFFHMVNSVSELLTSLSVQSAANTEQDRLCSCLISRCPVSGCVASATHVGCKQACGSSRDHICIALLKSVSCNRKVQALYH